MNLSRPLLAACLILIAAPSLPAEPAYQPSAPTQAKFEKMFGGKEVIDTVRNATSVEAARIETDLGTGEITQEDKPFVISAKDAALAKSLLSDRNSYMDGEDMCIFDPGVKLIFHGADGGAVTLIICLHCGDVRIMRGDKELGFANFYFAHGKMIGLAADIFPKDKDLRKMINERTAQEKKTKEDEARWFEGMPKSIKPLWASAIGNESNPDIRPLKAALKKQFPDTSKRILALLEWYGSGAGPWYHYPSYEDVPSDMLQDFATVDLVSTTEAASLDDRQVEGAPRLFATSELSIMRPFDGDNLSATLRKTLLNHVLKSKDPDKIRIFKNFLKSNPWR